MEKSLLTVEDIEMIAKNIDENKKVTSYKLKQASDKVMGYLGDHLNLIINFENDTEPITLFVKRIPINDNLKSDYIRRCNFFKKEYTMLNQLFREFNGQEFPDKWRPKAFLLKEELFAFENMSKMGYVMPDQKRYLTYYEIKSVVQAVAKFHAASYSYEHKMTKLKGRKYEIYEEFEEYLSEPPGGFSWRTAGMKSAIDVLCEFSKDRNKQNFKKSLVKNMPKLYDKAINLMKPDKKHQNVVVHRDLWANNILIKYIKEEPAHSVIVDFQTVLYASPFLDISTVLYFNTDAKFRENHLENVLKYYYDELKKCLEKRGIDVTSVLNQNEVRERYEESVLFGLTQASLIVPMVAMDGELLDRYFNNPVTFFQVNEVSRSHEFIEIAKKDEFYKRRIIEIFQETVDRFINIE